ncbi:MAG: RNA-binding protein [Gammaproteobacteria bacterium]
MKKLFVGSLPPSTTEESLMALFTPFGRVHSLKLVKDMFSGQCKGFGFLEMEGHEARAAIASLDGKSFEGNFINVKYEKEQKGRRR